MIDRIDAAITVSEGRPAWMALEREIKHRISEAMWAHMAEVGLVDPDPTELPDADINPDEAEPLPPDEPVKTDPIPEETE